MVLLLDANILLNYLMVREPGYSYAHQIINICREKKARAYMAFHTISILWYTLKNTPIPIRRQQIFDLCKCVTVVGVKHDKVVDALLNESFPDFEDCLQEKCAQSVRADYIVTENIKDFASSSVPFVTSAEMADILAKT